LLVATCAPEPEATWVISDVVLRRCLTRVEVGPVPWYGSDGTIDSSLGLPLEPATPDQLSYLRFDTTPLPAATRSETGPLCDG
jgi:hypothetical protein